MFECQFVVCHVGSVEYQFRVGSVHKIRSLGGFPYLAACNQHSPEGDLDPAGRG